MSDLTENQRGQIIGLHKGGVSYRSISKTLSFTMSVNSFEIVTFTKYLNLTFIFHDNFHMV